MLMLKFLQENKKLCFFKNTAKAELYSNTKSKKSFLSGNGIRMCFARLPTSITIPKLNSTAVNVYPKTIDAKHIRKIFDMHAV